MKKNKVSELIEKSIDITQKSMAFVDELPDDSSWAFAVISSMADYYMEKHGINRIKGWHRIYEVSIGLEIEPMSEDLVNLAEAIITLMEIEEDI